MYKGLVKAIVWILVMWRLAYAYRLCRGQYMYIGCVEIIVGILYTVVWRLVYGYWLCGGKSMDIGCVRGSVFSW